jgi:hypothetical protein
MSKQTDSLNLTDVITVDGSANKLDDYETGTWGSTVTGVIATVNYAAHLAAQEV